MPPDSRFIFPEEQLEAAEHGLVTPHVNGEEAR
jgi:hypothetical protein